jgi:signal transduction histidine kinase
MTLRRKMGLQIGAMIVGLMLVSGASLWGLNGLQQDYGDALATYAELRQIYEAGSHLQTARTLLASPAPERVKAVEHVRDALTLLEAEPSGGGGGGAAPGGAAVGASQRAIAAGVRDALAEMHVWQRIGGDPPADSITRVIRQIRDAASNGRAQIEASQAAAVAKRRTTLAALALLCAAVILAAVLLGTWQYNGVLRPLRSVGDAVRLIAAGHFSERVPEHAHTAGAGLGVDTSRDDEFAALARDFNRMAAELDGLYRDLEKKVSAKSKELIRSERLASVGFLAAGVAHEINNPLGIISGYAENALAEMRDGKSPPPDDIDGTLRVIRDEAFRCKDITGKLLSLARPGEGQRQAVDLARVAEDVVSVLGGLPSFKDRTITVRAESRESLVVNAIEGEVKQVLMNLLLNALEATAGSGGTGEVRVTVSRTGGGAGGGGGGAVALAVADNGRGMAPETLERVFEPFFTERRPRDPGAVPRPGTGLGLSITHAIVQSHGGRITAHSDGAGQGSRFTIELPAASAAESAAAR